VAWGYARGADQRGVDLIQNCEVTGIDIEGGKVVGVQTTRGRSGRRRWDRGGGPVVQVAAMAGMRLPIESHILQAFVTEGLKPVINHVISFGMGHFYISQSDKGGLVFGGDLDFYASYAARGNLPMVEHVMEAGMTLMPMIGRAKVLRSLGRHHGHVAGRVARSSTRRMSRGCSSTAAGTTAASRRCRPVGWCMAHLMATGEPRGGPPLPPGPFATGHLLDEEGTGSQHNLH
jgi:heterotetrameric sarcosine oxidase beta subunit